MAPGSWGCLSRALSHHIQVPYNCFWAFPHVAPSPSIPGHSYSSFRLWCRQHISMKLCCPRTHWLLTPSTKFMSLHYIFITRIFFHKYVLELDTKPSKDRPSKPDCLVSVVCPVPGTNPGTEQILNKYLHWWMNQSINTSIKPLL